MGYLNCKMMPENLRQFKKLPEIKYLSLRCVSKKIGKIKDYLTELW